MKRILILSVAVSLLAAAAYAEPADCKALRSATAQCDKGKRCSVFVTRLQAVIAKDSVLGACEGGLDEKSFDVLAHLKLPDAQKFFCSDTYHDAIGYNASLSETYGYADQPYTGDPADEVAGEDPEYYRTLTDCRKIAGH